MRPMFLETICIKNGAVRNLQAHVERMRRTAEHFGFAAPELPCLEVMLPEPLRDKKVKCRIEYKGTICNIGFTAYTPKVIRSLRLVKADNVDYSFKFSDRARLDALNNRRGQCDEALIVQNGCITDTTYSNVVFRKNKEFFTPGTCLLNGTKRQKLLRESIIREAEITVDNLHEYEHVYLINSMLDIEDGVGIPVRNIYPSGHW
ncbi:MAG: hypothetical protein BGO33_04120 [Bacteroidia bacterium 43-41]|nr:MAG: hypothetical protein BGO33_04120 [Bacteroidia bacterium 43-41]